MTIDEHTRHGIHSWLVGAMGTDLGDGLMSMLPSTGWADVATKHDLAELEARLDLRFEMIDRRFEMIDHRFEASEQKILGALDRRLNDTLRAMFFALAALLLTMTTIVVSVVLATR